MLELAVLAAAACALMVVLNPRGVLVRQARTAFVGAHPDRAMLGPNALVRASLSPVLGGPARMPRFAPAVAFGGPRSVTADEIAALLLPAVDTYAPAQIVAASTRREPAASRSASTRRKSEPVTAAQGAARVARPSLRSTRQETLASR